MNARAVSSFESPDVACDAVAKEVCAEHRETTKLRTAIKGCVAGIVLVGTISVIGYLAWDHASRRAQAEADASQDHPVPTLHGIESVFPPGR
jgi:hypothetical protein